MRFCRVCIYLVFIFFFTDSYSQEYRKYSFSGYVSVKDLGESVSGANVIIQDVEGRRIYSYTLTDDYGHFSLSAYVLSDSVLITVAGFNIKKSSKLIPVSQSVCDFTVTYEKLMIEDVVVKAEAVKRRGDTVTYIVDMYRDSVVDKSIGEVLKKMPGIDVTSAGKVLYNNQPISKLYIDGMDLMGGRYGVAINNVRAKDISTVEVLENHQHVKALEGIEFPTDAAINLKLKKDAKGSLISTIQLGAGYMPLLWNGEVMMMYFNPSWQTLTTFKTNNSGNDVVSELESHYDYSQQESSELSVYYPITPDTDKERYMDNVSYVVSVNNVIKIPGKKDDNFNINAVYINDKNIFNSSSLTSYFIPGNAPLTLSEEISATEHTDELELTMSYVRNDKKKYLSEQLSFEGIWDNNLGNVVHNSDSVAQSNNMKYMGIVNRLQYVIKLKRDYSLKMNSFTTLSQMPSTLQISPTIFPELFGYGSQHVIQELSKAKVMTDNNISINKQFIKTKIHLRASVGVKAEFQTMKSALYSPPDPDPKDGFINDLCYNEVKLYSNIGLLYNYKKLRIAASISPCFIYFGAGDNSIYLNPKATVDWKLSHKFYFSFDGRLTGNAGPASSRYNGYIMKDYRNIICESGDIPKSLLQSYLAELRYADAIHSVFGAVKAYYLRSNNNILYGTSFQGALSRIDAYMIDNVSSSFGINARIEKRFNDISTTVAIPIDYTLSWIDILRQSNIANTMTSSVAAGINISSRISGNFVIDCYSGYRRFSSRIRNHKGGLEYLSPINTMHNRLGLNLILFQRLTFRLSGEHYYNDALSIGSRNIVFIDASVKYKTKTVEYILDGRNLMNVKTYNQRIYSEVNTYQYHYKLRPLSVMFIVRFNIGV